jgi:SAM-dependent methyltransferase
MSLWSEFLTNQQRPIHKWIHYFPIYERHLDAFRNRSATILEIGCGRGGSLQKWKRWLGPLVTVVGLDIDPECRTFEEDQIQVRIGDQKDPMNTSATSSVGSATNALR